MEILTEAGPDLESLPDAAIVRRVRAGEHALFELLMRRHNQRVYRAVRSVVPSESDAEDAMQQAYISAFTHLHQFQERSQFSTWLITIALREAFSRRRKAQGERISGELMDTHSSPQPDPERQAYGQELRRLLESAVDALPDTYRTVFMLRDVEGLSTTETGQTLGLGDEAVKTRLHRARAMLRQTIKSQMGQVATEAFQFPAVRCDRVVAAVLAKITATSGGCVSPPVR
jgi:RNA polymerase sigma-70 factor (ECF subfamily)